MSLVVYKEVQCQDIVYSKLPSISHLVGQFSPRTNISIVRIASSSVLP